MRRCFVAILSAFALLAVPATASAAPLTGSLGAGSLESGSLGSIVSGSTGFWGSLAPDEDETYDEVDPTSGTLIVTSDFRVDSDGFKYENWGEPSAEHPRTLTAQSMQSLYGDKICARIVNGECALTAAGGALQTDLNDFLTGGHCYGFAAASGLFATGAIVKGDYLQPNTTVFENDPTVKVDDLIKRYASSQISDPTDGSKTKESVSATLDRIKAAWAQGDYHVLSVFGENGGHAVTPIALRDLGKGKTGIVVYDNNFPGFEKMVVTDPAANTWYYTAKLNPSTPGTLYVGSPTNQMQLSDPTASTQKQECPICVDGDESVLVMIKDNSWVAGSEVPAWDFTITLPGGGEIPGMESRSLAINKKAALFSIPAGTAFDINLVGAPSGATADADVSLYGDGWINELDKIALQPGATAKVSVDAAQRKLSLSGSTVLKPVLSLATEQADWSVSAAAGGLQLQPGATLSVERDADGDFVYGLAGAGDPGLMAIGIKRTDKVGDRIVWTNGPVSIPVGSEASVAANAWDGISPLIVRVVGVGVDESYPMS